MSSHQNSAFNQESVLRLARPTLVHSRVSEARSSARIGVSLNRPPDQVWGHYNNYRANGVAVSALVHIAVIGLLLSGVFVSHQITQKQTREVVTLIAPSPETYTLPVAKTVASGGGGGGDRDVLPAPKGNPPKAALEQITPPAIVMHNSKPKLAVQPTVVAPPTVNVAENHAPNLGIPAPKAAMPAAPPSNGTGSGGGIGS